MLTENWNGITFKKFINCSNNPAWNRQVRMLSDLVQYNCSRTDARMLEEAKARLSSMAFFGLVEYQNASGVLFESTFGVKFTKSFRDHLSAARSRSVSLSKENVDISKNDLETIRRLNNLDIELYKYAKDLFSKRIATIMINSS